MEQTRISRVYCYMTLKCDLDLESGYLSAKCIIEKSIRMKRVELLVDLKFLN